MNVLVCMETSRVVSDAFERAGHEAWSCDLLPCETDSARHLQGDAFDAIRSRPWDLIIMHPTCTTLCVSGNHVYAKGKPRHAERLAAVEWTARLWHEATRVCPRVALENPVGVLTTMTDLPRPSYVQPHEFGDDASKRTALFLHGLPPLTPTRRVPGRLVNGVERWSNQTDSGQNRLGPSPTRWRERSRTYQGIADAMAAQWLPAKSPPA